MKKMMVVKMDISDEKFKLRAMKSVSGFTGVDSISWDMKEAQKKLKITGDIDPVDIVTKLRKHSHAELLLVGPAEEPEKKKEPDEKKKEPKKEEAKKK
ncbi:heavy metal-associated isoprenylated plant protein 39-like [Papaver somniferum]|uniref:heavy metal-associated isoprenylated plant protein 39-like n=1 Tax=Papaver somniferum TaxID=3469 RepID=UPI000E6FBB7D|nr:heavy metal-associated isoprenylated plant protein 39-like [Papaver somniferum]